MEPGRLKKSRPEWAVDELVLAKVKGFPKWPARVGNAEDLNHKLLKNKVFVIFFGPGKTVRQCTPRELSPFSATVRDELLSGLSKRKAKPGFREAVEEICEEFDWRQQNPGKVRSRPINGDTDTPGGVTSAATVDAWESDSRKKEVEQVGADGSMPGGGGGQLQLEMEDDEQPLEEVRPRLSKPAGTAVSFKTGTDQELASMVAHQQIGKVAVASSELATVPPGHGAALPFLPLEIGKRGRHETERPESDDAGMVSPKRRKENFVSRDNNVLKTAGNTGLEEAVIGRRDREGGLLHMETETHVTDGHELKDQKPAPAAPPATQSAHPSSGLYSTSPPLPPVPPPPGLVHGGTGSWQGRDQAALSVSTGSQHGTFMVPKKKQEAMSNDAYGPVGMADASAQHQCNGEVQAEAAPMAEDGPGPVEAWQPPEADAGGQGEVEGIETEVPAYAPPLPPLPPPPSSPPPSPPPLPASPPPSPPPLPPPSPQKPGPVAPPATQSAHPSAGLYSTSPPLPPVPPPPALVHGGTGSWQGRDQAALSVSTGPQHGIFMVPLPPGPPPSSYLHPQGQQDPADSPWLASAQLAPVGVGWPGWPVETLVYLQGIEGYAGPLRREPVPELPGGARAVAASQGGRRGVRHYVSIDPLVASSSGKRTRARQWREEVEETDAEETDAEGIPGRSRRSPSLSERLAFLSDLVAALSSSRETFETNLELLREALVSLSAAYDRVRDDQNAMTRLCRRLAAATGVELNQDSPSAPTPGSAPIGRGTDEADPSGLVD